MFSKVTSVFDHFKKPADPKDLVRKWQSELRSEQRGMERQIRDLAREEKLAQKNVRMILTFFLLFHMLPSLDLAERREKINKREERRDKSEDRREEREERREKREERSEKR